MCLRLNESNRRVLRALAFQAALDKRHSAAAGLVRPKARAKIRCDLMLWVAVLQRSGVPVRVRNEHAQAV